MPTRPTNLFESIIQRQRGVRLTSERVDLSADMNRIKLTKKNLWVITLCGKLYSKTPTNRDFQLELIDTTKLAEFSGNIIQVNNDDDFSCHFLTDTGQVYARGLNNLGQLGLPISGPPLESFTKLCPEKNFHQFSGKIIQLQVLDYCTYFLTDTQKFYKCGLERSGLRISPQRINFEDFSEEIFGKIVYFHVLDSRFSERIFLTNLGEVWIKNETSCFRLERYEKLCSEGLTGVITQIIIADKVQLLTSSGQIWESHYVCNKNSSRQGFVLINNYELIDMKKEKICFISHFGELHPHSLGKFQLLITESKKLKILDKNYMATDLKLPNLDGEIISAAGSNKRRVFFTANNELWCTGDWFNIFREEMAENCEREFKKIPLNGL